MKIVRLGSRRRALQLAFGLIWLVDAALQFQPYMFSTAFSREVLSPSGAGNPGWVSHPVHLAATITAHHPATVNAAFATIQLLIALGLFTPATVRVALIGSFVWALGIWWIGEGLGGLLVTAQSPIADSPGAALLYALMSVLLWPATAPVQRRQSAASSVADTSPLRPVGARVVWIALWAAFAVETMQAANRAPRALHDMISRMAQGEPSWLAAIDDHVAKALGNHGAHVSIGLAIAFLAIALSVLAPPTATRVALVVAGCLAAAIWVIGQNLGEIATGQATDPNTGPLLILLAAAYWPLTASRVRGPFGTNVAADGTTTTAAPTEPAQRDQTLAQ